MAINTVALSGRLTADAELRESASGVSVLRFSLAVNERRKDESGEWAEHANFFDCTVLGNRAAALAQYLEKGRHVSLCGKLQWRAWEDREGNRRTAVSVLVDEIDLGARNRDDEHGGAVAALGSPPPLRAPAPPSPSADDEMIPF